MEPKPSTGGEPIRQPLQARSRETMDRILESLETLLAEKSFDKITMIELAQHSGTGTSSIYARFKDKPSLILGMHMRLRERALGCLSGLTDPHRWGSRSIEDIVAGVVQQSVRFYREHGPLIRAALFVDEPSVRERQASVLRSAEQQFSDFLAHRWPDADRGTLDGAIDASCRLFASVLYAELIFGEVRMVRVQIGDAEFRRQLVVPILALLHEAHPGG